MGFFVQDYQDFRGNILELSELAIKCSNFLGLPGETEKINERTIRYYVTEGLVDRPTRIGREAQYEYIHLLQFLASRYLVATGYPMAKVAPYIASRSMHELEKFVSHPTKPNLAELLVASFSKASQLSKDRINPSFRTPRSITEKSIKLQKSDLKLSAFKSQSSMSEFDSPETPDLFSKVSMDAKAFTKSEASEDCAREIARLQNQVRMMQRRLDETMEQMSDQLKMQSHKQIQQVEQHRRVIEDLIEQFNEERQQWLKELQELKQMIQDRLPPFRKERTPAPERAQASIAQLEVPLHPPEDK